MELITLNNFPKDFRDADMKTIFNYALTGKFCQVVCVPGGGKATLLKLLASNENLRKYHLKEKFPSTKIVYLDLHELPSFERYEVEKYILLEIDPNITAETDPLRLTKQLNVTFSNLVEKGQSIIFLLDHFDEFQNQLHTSFFQLLKGLRTLNKYKFSTVFGTRRDLKELVDPQIFKDFYDFFTDDAVYLKIYDQRATEVMFAQIEQAFDKKLTPTQKETIMKLTAGHAKLTKILAETTLREKIPLERESLFSKPLIKEALLELWLFLTAQEQQYLKAITDGKTKEENELAEKLIKFDILRSTNEFTIPLFAEFVKNQKQDQQKITYKQQTKEILKGEKVISDLLSRQEYRLLRFLIENEEKIVSREEIITSVWPDAQAQEGISDEAIDQMIFRLRKKIEDEPNSPKHLTTVKGQGFRFIA